MDLSAELLGRRAFMSQSLGRDSQATRKAGAEGEANTTARSGARGRDEHIQDAEGGGGCEGDDNNLLHVELLLGDQHRADADRKALNQILNGALNEFGKIKCGTAHLCSIQYLNKIFFLENKNIRVQKNILIPKYT